MVGVFVGTYEGPGGTEGNIFRYVNVVPLSQDLHVHRREGRRWEEHRGVTWIVVRTSVHV